MNAKSETFFIKALHDAKTEELIKAYQEKHFSANKQVKIDDVEFDVVVTQGDKTIVFEIRVLPLSPTEMSEIDQCHHKAKALGYDFRLITIAKPKKSTIEITWLEPALLEYLATHPQDIGATYARSIDYQSLETAIQSIEITDSQALVGLDGNLSVNLMSNAVDAMTNDKPAYISEMLPFQGKLSLNLSEHKIKKAFLTVDNHYWYNGG
jgi:hypothetical protein